MKAIETRIPGVFIIEPDVHKDARGYFYESFNLREFESKVAPVTFVQDNESRSCYGVVRGLHFQAPPFAQAKLVSVAVGEVLDVAVDIREGSPTYGEHVAVRLSSENHRRLFIPKGFAHGFSVLSEQVIFQYKCDAYYEPSSEGGIAWNDPALGIDWMIPSEEVILSEKDSHRKNLSEAGTPFIYNISDTRK